MPGNRSVIAGGVFTSMKDAEAFAKKIPEDLKWEIVQSNGHSLVCVKDYGDVDGTYNMCRSAGVRAFIWRRP